MQANDVTKWVWGASLLACAALAQAAHNDWAEGTPGTANGATRDYYNRAGLLAWNHFMGDWRDAAGKSQGDVPFASASVIDDDRGKYVEWNVSDLVRGWIDGTHPNRGFFLRTVGDGGTIVFCSREHERTDDRPRLIVLDEKGSMALEAEADTFLTKSTYRSQGQTDELRVSGGPDHLLIRFDLDRVSKRDPPSKATLRLYTTRQYGPATIGVFRCAQGHQLPPSEPVPGLAADYPGDQGIGSHKDVLFRTDFESDRWADEWTQAAERDVIDTIAADPVRRFQPLQGKALRVRIAKGSNGALNTTYQFKSKNGWEPDEIYFRYYLRLADDWNQTVQGGKLPGISGTYGVAGWGGRKSDGTDGWSARGAFHLTIPHDNPLAGLTPMGTYCYHADMKDHYGDQWVWQNDYRGFLANNRWYAVEQYLKLNSPGETNGVLRAWVDGRLAFEKSDIRFRHVDRLKIEQVWMNVYHGGKIASPYDQHLYIDNVVIAKQYIGPMRLLE